MTMISLMLSILAAIITIWIGLAIFCVVAGLTSLIPTVVIRKRSALLSSFP